MNNLNENFLLELFKLCFRQREVIEVCKAHLKYEYLPIEAYKTLWKAMKREYTTSSKLPTIGIMAQLFQSPKVKEKEEALRLDILDVLEKIKDIDIPERDPVFKQLENYIKDSMSVEFYEDFGNIYNEGDRDKARTLIMDFSDKLSKFSIRKNAETFEQIFKGFERRQIRNRLKVELGEDVKKRVPFGIDELDEITGGGIDVTDTVLFCMQSGKGKTKALRWFGVSAARRGFKVLHIQLEGAKSECEEGYDATWTAQSIHDLELGVLKPEVMDKLKVRSEQVRYGGGEIYIEAYEEFGSASLLDVRSSIIAFEKVYGVVPDEVLIDYFELLEPGDGKKYGVHQERERRRAIGKGIKNIAVEFRTRLIVPTQASTITTEEANNPEFVMTRYNLSEFKAALDPFSIFFTGNQTADEYSMGIMRLYIDKLRKRRSNQIIRIIQSYRTDKFYNRKQTMKEMHGEEV